MAKEDIEVRTGICKDCIRPCKIKKDGKYPIGSCEFKRTKESQDE